MEIIKNTLPQIYPTTCEGQELLFEGRHLYRPSHPDVLRYFQDNSRS